MDGLVTVRFTGEECGTNGNGIAVSTYERNDTWHELTFVRDEAVSRLQPGARYDAALRNAPVSRELLFNRRFFQKLAREIDDARAHPMPPIGDGSEYDKADAEQARRERLGATPSSSFLNIGVDNQEIGRASCRERGW